METNKNLLVNKAMIWGLYTAIANIVLSLLFYFTGHFLSDIKGWIEIATFVAGIILVSYAYRGNIEEKDPFTYGQALGLGVLTSFFASIVIAVFTFILLEFIDPSLIDQMITTTEEAFLQTGLDESLVEKQMEIQQKFMTPPIISLSSIFSYVVYGLIISLITSIFLRKKPADGFEAAMNEIDDED